MIDVESRFLTGLSQTTILATPFGAGNNQSSQTRRYPAHRRVRPAVAAEFRFARILSNESSSARFTSPWASRLSDSVSGSPRSCRSSNVCRRASTPRGRRSFARSPGISSSIATVRDISNSQLSVRQRGHHSCPARMHRFCTSRRYYYIPTMSWKSSPTRSLLNHCGGRNECGIDSALATDHDAVEVRPFSNSSSLSV